MFTGLICAALVLAPPGRMNTPAPIVIDGYFKDWAGTKIAVADPTDAPDAELDLGEVRIKNDARFVHLSIELGRDVNLQRLNGSLRLLFDADGDISTGAPSHGLNGVDFVVQCTPPSTRQKGEAGMGFGVLCPRYTPGTDANGVIHPPLSPYDIGLTFAPTHANSRVEMRIDRRAELPGAAPLFIGRSFTAKLVLVNDEGIVVDETEAFEHQLVGGIIDPGLPYVAKDPVARAEGTDLRIVSWNAQHSSWLKHPEKTLRVLAAVKPDIVLMQEYESKDSAEALEKLFNQLPGSEMKPWKAFIGSGGGNMHCVILTHLPMEIHQGMEPIAYPGWDGRYLRTAAAVIDTGTRKLLAMSLHLKCCGRLGDSADAKRIIETRAVREALQNALPTLKVDGVIMAGDFNLVGGREPLDNLTGATGIGVLKMTALEPLQIDGRCHATWTDFNEPFVPGRLDYILHSSDEFTCRNAFVLDTRDIPAQHLIKYGLEALDTLNISDHLPVVADLVWTKSAAQ